MVEAIKDQWLRGAVGREGKVGKAQRIYGEKKGFVPCLAGDGESTNSISVPRENQRRDLAMGSFISAF